MVFRTVYKTPDAFSDMILESDGEFLTGLWFEDPPDSGKAERKGGKSCETICQKPDQADDQSIHPVFAEAVRWLDIYFSGRDPGFTPAYDLSSLTLFQKSVTDIMLKIPFGKTTTYGKIASEIALEKGIPKMSAQAVGDAVGRNPICLIIPCHRVIGSDGSLIGYGGGLSNKEALLRHEGALG